MMVKTQDCSLAIDVRDLRAMMPFQEGDIVKIYEKSDKAKLETGMFYIPNKGKVEKVYPWFVLFKGKGGYNFTVSKQDIFIGTFKFKVLKDRRNNGK